MFTRLPGRRSIWLNGQMANIPQDYVSDFVRAIMPGATEDELLEGQHNLDSFLDVLDQIYEHWGATAPPNPQDK
jgi:hypothetical protein